MSMEVDLNMSSVVVVPKSNKRRINFLLSKIAELQEEHRNLEALEEEYEAFRSSKVTKRTKGRPQAKKTVEEEVDLFANLVKEVVSSSSECNECVSENNNNDGFTLTFRLTRFRRFSSLFLHVLYDVMMMTS